MQRIVCLLANNLTQRAFEPLGKGPSAFDRALAFVRARNAQGYHVFAEPKFAAQIATLAGSDVPVETAGSWGWEAILDFLLAHYGEGYEILFAYADAPFLNNELLQKLEALHRPYRAQFTFADAFPSGLGLEILDASVLGPVKTLASRHPEIAVARDGLFALLKTDVNAFDIETELPPVDLRLQRLRLFCDRADSTLYCERLAELGTIGPETPLENLLLLLQENGELRRTLPGFYQIQLTDNCRQACSYCPYGQDPSILTRKGYMDPDKLLPLVDQIAHFSQEAVIDVSLWGEPSAYPAFLAFARRVLSHQGLELYVETSGIGWNRADIEALSAEADGRMNWIVSLDSLDPVVYQTMRGEGYAEAWDFGRWVSTKFPKKTWLQAVRCQTNEHVLHPFYQEAQKQGLQVIIQKYDHFSQQLKDLRVSDIAPFRRFPCWHLIRDMNILMDGTVVRCREDLEKSDPKGNVFTETLEAVWERNKDNFRTHLTGTWTGLCEQCDEYYTFNA